ncbi:dihydrodipicolinate synthase family protein [Rubellimicrobium rubrum]|uniref:Dihydrodipicolinate synthase family protein n=1 Tax=Rubellimicrobium rubrum TaxID=2585369 RepID=A0A5C4MUC6_9RHOB|nr:dihydrodipicolinate synthase family protein [Rubellimicrobium rubrum]TNC47709.1 dihydrodipicolinate synthase family protein [Rubellimicrobium rubrum]
MTLFHGLSAFPLTPAGAAGQVQTEALCLLLERIRKAGADSVGLLGSTGAYPYLSRSERRRTVEAAVESLGGQTPVVVGVGALRTDEAQELARDAEEAGADGLLLAPMSYQPLTDGEVYQHVLAVTEATGLPLCLYNNPTTTRFTFSPNLIAELAQVPGVAAVKMPLPADGDYAGELGRIRAMVPASFAIGHSGDWGAANALLAGSNAWFSVVAGLLPAPALRLARAAQAGDAEDARRVDDAFQPLWSLFRQWGSFRVMYALADVLGLGAFEPPRPLLPIGPEVRARLGEALDRLATLSLPTSIHSAP